MKIKLFIKDKSLFQSWRKHTQDFEDEINTWLAAHPGIRIVEIKQSSNGGSLETTKIVISVWYEPDAAGSWSSSSPPTEAFSTRPRS
jgi:hypothetical protein